MSSFLFNVFYAAVIHAVQARFSENPYIFWGLVHLEEDLGEDGAKVGPPACVLRAAWGMMYADNEDIGSTSAEGLAKMMTVILTVFDAAGLTVPERKTETMLLRTPSQATQTSPIVIEAVGQR